LFWFSLRGSLPGESLKLAIKEITMIESIKAVHKTIQTSSRYLKLMMESGEFKDQNEAFIVLRASLKALRDRIEPGEAVHLGSQIPALLRGFYFEGWDFTGHQTKSRKINEFLHEVRIHLHGHDDIDLAKTVPVAMRVVLDQIDQGEAVQILHNIPKEIRELYP
jgi:uncharacterized protein (DUF2267 family)